MKRGTRRPISEGSPSEGDPLHVEEPKEEVPADASGNSTRPPRQPPKTEAEDSWLGEPDRSEISIKPPT